MSARHTIGEIVFDPASGELIGPSGRIRLAPQPASLLGLLLSHGGEVVSRDAVREHLWPGGKVEFDQGIAFAVREIRKAIEAAGGDPDLLETIPKRGLRLHATHRASGDLDAPSSARPADRERVVARAARRGAILVGAAVLGGIIAVVLVTRLLGTGAPVVAYVPHEARGGDAAAEASARIGAALTTALTVELGDAAGVIGPTGTARLAGPNDTEGARTLLGACLVLSGSVESRDADSLIVFTQIVRAADRVHVWANLDTVRTSTGMRALLRSIESGVRTALPDC